MGESYKYVLGPFGRLRKILNRSNDALIAEYRYNGLGYRIAVHEDTDTDGDVDGDDDWFYSIFDERWREVTRFQEGEANPVEEFVYHAAGLDGLGSSSYIDLVVLRDRDEGMDGTFEERHYYCQNWRADVSAIVTAGGAMVEWVKYSPYGIPFGLPRGDANSDGISDGTDVSIVAGWSGSSYDVRGDLNLDGVVDATDESLMAAANGGWEVLSPSGVGQRRGHVSRRAERFSINAMECLLLDTSLGRVLSPVRGVYSSGRNCYVTRSSRARILHGASGGSSGQLGSGGGWSTPGGQGPIAPTSPEEDGNCHCEPKVSNPLRSVTGSGWTLVCGKVKERFVPGTCYWKPQCEAKDCHVAYKCKIFFEDETGTLHSVREYDEQHGGSPGPLYWAWHGGNDVSWSGSGVPPAGCATFSECGQVVILDCKQWMILRLVASSGTNRVPDMNGPAGGSHDPYSQTIESEGVLTCKCEPPPSGSQ